MRDAKARRVVAAVLARLDDFCAQAEAIHDDAADPRDRVRAGRLMRDITQLRHELENIAGGGGQT